MSRIHTCRNCGGSRLAPFFDLGDQPLANALLTREAAERGGEKFYPLSLVYCEDCGLSQLDYTVDPGDLFRHYVWMTSTSGTARAYAMTFCQRVFDRLGEAPSRYVLEAASNDGTFLKPFQERGCKVLGIDPAENIAGMANAAGIPTRAEFFSEKTAADTVSEYGIPSVAFARNVLPHVSDPHDFLSGFAKCFGSDTLGVLEVHYSGVILDELHYDSIYHEHLCYFTLKTVEDLLARHGLYPFDLERSPISGGSIVLYLRSRKTEKTARLLEMERGEKEKGYNTLACWQGFARDSHNHRDQLLEYLAGNEEWMGYGASARSSTLLNFCGIRSLTSIADQNPLKNGLLTPGTHIPIAAPDEAMARRPQRILLLAWNFQDEIRSILRERYAYRGELLIPLPNRPVREVIS